MLRTESFNKGCKETGHTKLNRGMFGSLKMVKAILNVTSSLCNVYYKMQQSLRNNCYKEEIVLNKYRTEIKGGVSLHSRHLTTHCPVSYSKSVSYLQYCKTGNHKILYTQSRVPNPKKGFLPTWVTINTEKGIQT